MTRLCSRNLTQRPAFGGDDNAFPTCGLRIKARRFWWVTLSEHKWVILGERRGTNPIESLQEQYGSDLAPQLTCDGIPEGRTGRIKALLMNPTFIAGIGNIYSDEILYAARIHPLSRVDQLVEPRLSSLYRCMRAVLRKAIRLRGTGIEGSRDSPAGYDRVRMVYQQKLCPNGHAVHRIKASGRSAHFYPMEQKLYRHAST